ncbi:hypothetical protein AAHA92_14275 [Salvia divinorum]|uniref:Uncharacterized protein n=1 Tax=Salvia divinorum TaxID=28513 RepID=A0ABD1HBK6_SALDI
MSLDGARTPEAPDGGPSKQLATPTARQLRGFGPRIQARDVKLNYMREILLRYYPENERIRLQKHREYRQKIISNYQRLHLELYNMHPTNFFVPSFLKAINENTEQAFRNIMSEPSP